MAKLFSAFVWTVLRRDSLALLTLRSLCLLLAYVGPLAAEPVPVAQPGDDQAGVALVQVFARFCLDRLPTPGDVSLFAGTQYRPMPAEAVKLFFHEDLGHGWTLDADGGKYVITVEDPPYHTCAVRRLYVRPPRADATWLQTIRQWADCTGRAPFKQGDPQQMRDGPLSIVGTIYTANGGGGDGLMDIRTTYPDGRVEQRFARRAVETGQ